MQYMTSETTLFYPWTDLLDYNIRYKQIMTG